jgi:hypothetical protein
MIMLNRHFIPRKVMCSCGAAYLRTNGNQKTCGHANKSEKLKTSRKVPLMCSVNAGSDRDKKFRKTRVEDA